MSLIVLIILISVLVYFWSQRKFYTLKWKIPGPIGLPIIGVSLNLLQRKKILSYFQANREKYGPIYSVFLGHITFVVTTDPKIAEKFLTSSNFLDKAVIYTPVSYGLGGENLFSSKSSKWIHNRKMLNSAFNHKILRSFFPIFNNKIRIFNQKLEKLTGPNGVLDFFHMMEQCTLDIGFETTMGVEMNFQSGKNKAVIENFCRGVEITTERIFCPWLLNDFLFQFLPSGKCLKQIQSRIFPIFEKVIENRLIVLNEKKNVPLTKNVDDNITKSNNIFVDKALELFMANQLTWTDVKSETNTIILAAYETTANAIYLTLMCLAMHPEYQDKLFDEVYTMFPEKEMEVTCEHTQQMPYTDMIINETMRVIPPVPIVGRSCSEDYQLNNDIIIPKGTQIGVDIFNMHRDKNIWGPYAHKFYPDHFLKSNVESIHPYAFIPFNKGMRNCIGWRYALLSLKVMLVHIIRNFSVTTTFKFEDLIFIEDIVVKLDTFPILSFENRNI